MAGAECPAARGKASSPFQPGKVRLPPQYLPALEARAGPHGLPIAVGLHPDGGIRTSLGRSFPVPDPVRARRADRVRLAGRPTA